MTVIIAHIPGIVVGLGNGYQRSSAWCFSRKAGMFDEYIVEHDEYLGLGSGAFSYLAGSLFASTFSIEHYLDLVDGGATGTVRRRDLSERDEMRYYLLIKLFGGTLDLAAAEARFDGRFQRTLWPELAQECASALLGCVSSLRHPDESALLAGAEAALAIEDTKLRHACSMRHWIVQSAMCASLQRYLGPFC